MRTFGVWMDRDAKLHTIPQYDFDALLSWPEDWQYLGVL